MHRTRYAAVLWILGALAFPAQLLASLRWPVPYSWTGHLISDLGTTTCGIIDAGSRAERYVCSPWHALANGATIANGALLAAGALLLWNAWPRRTPGRWASALLGVGGLLVVGVGLVPWDAAPELHAAFALSQAPAQWAGMALVAAASWRTGRTPGIPALTCAALAVSVAGFALFVDAVGGGPSLALGLGLAERIAFDTLTLWSAAVGCLLLRRHRGPDTAGTVPATARVATHGGR